MRNIFLILLILFPVLVFSQEGRFPFHTATSTDGAPPPPSYLALAHYPMNGNGNDTTGNGNNATLTNMVWNTTTPAAGSANGNFSGITAEFITPSGLVGSSTFSVSFWFRQNSSGGYYEFIDPHRDNTNYEYWFIWLDGVQYDIEFRGYQNTTNTLDNAGTSSSVWTPAFVWNHLICTYDDGAVTFYYNGTELSMPNPNTWGIADMKINRTFRIGESFSGEIDEVSFFDVVLSAAQKIEVYNGGVPGYIL